VITSRRTRLASTTPQPASFRAGVDQLGAGFGFVHGVGEVLFGVGDCGGDSREGFIEDGDDALLFGEAGGAIRSTKSFGALVAIDMTLAISSCLA
jgi:hypothetical protein